MFRDFIPLYGIIARGEFCDNFINGLLVNAVIVEQHTLFIKPPFERDTACGESNTYLLTLLGIESDILFIVTLIIVTDEENIVTHSLPPFINPRQTEYVREGDTLYIESISRLGRSTKDLLNIIDTLTDKGVTLISHKEKIDTDTPAGKFMLTVFAALSQLEREQLKQRQREGIEIAKAQGKYTGRKPIPTDWTRFGQLYGEWRAKHITGRDFMRRMDMSANTFYRRVREYELRHGITEPTSA